MKNASKVLARIVAVIVLLAGCGLALRVGSAQQTGVERAELQRHDLDVSGREVIQVRVELAPGGVR